MSVSLDIQKPQGSIPTAHYDVVVVGAGPYGLSAAAHLQARGLKVAIFGKPIHFWRENMPQGMLLRSYWWASNCSDPQGKYGFKQYFQAEGLQPTNPLPIETFIDYGLWFQKNAVPNLDETYVASVEHKDKQFLVTLEDGRVVQSKTVVMAPGLHYYAYCPAEYMHLPSSLVSHSSEHHLLDKFAGKKVAIIGRGQAALETAALLNENGANVQIITRGPIRWLPSSNTKIPAFLRTLRAPQAGMGNGWLNVLMERFPYGFYRLPRNTKEHLIVTRHGPAGSTWLRPRILDKISLYEGKQVEKVAEENGQVKLTLSDGEEQVVDHVILATGYKADVKRLPMLHASLRDSIQTSQGSPILNTHFESTIPGLYFIGYSAVRSFGFLYRFVLGSEAAARRVTSAVSQLVTRSK